MYASEIPIFKYKNCTSLRREEIKLSRCERRYWIDILESDVEVYPEILPLNKSRFKSKELFNRIEDSTRYTYILSVEEPRDREWIPHELQIQEIYAREVSKLIPNEVTVLSPNLLCDIKEYSKVRLIGNSEFKLHSKCMRIYRGDGDCPYCKAVTTVRKCISKYASKYIVNFDADLKIPGVVVHATIERGCDTILVLRGNPDITRDSLRRVFDEIENSTEYRYIYLPPDISEMSIKEYLDYWISNSGGGVARFQRRDISGKEIMLRLVEEEFSIDRYLPCRDIRNIIRSNNVVSRQLPTNSVQQVTSQLVELFNQLNSWRLESHDIKCGYIKVYSVAFNTTIRLVVSASHTDKDSKWLATMLDKYTPSGDDTQDQLRFTLLQTVYAGNMYYKVEGYVAGTPWQYLDRTKTKPTDEYAYIDGEDRYPYMTYTF